MVAARPDASGVVEIDWWTPLGPGIAATIERRTAYSEWDVRGTAFSDAAGRIRFRDKGASAGERFAYRAGNGGEWSEETWISVPAQALAFTMGTMQGGS